MPAVSRRLRKTSASRNTSGISGCSQGRFLQSSLPRAHDTRVTRNRYPLIEAGMSRSDCIDWWEDRYYKPPERSACVACPFQSRRRWEETMHRWPELFAEAVEIDANMRGGVASAREPYLHPRRIPLAEAVGLDQAEMAAGLERDGFVNECEGHCGV